jgi:hypothetical protein
MYRGDNMKKSNFLKASCFALVAYIAQTGGAHANFLDKCTAAQGLKHKNAGDQKKSINSGFTGMFSSKKTTDSKKKKAADEGPDQVSFDCFKNAKTAEIKGKGKKGTTFVEWFVAHQDGFIKAFKHEFCNGAEPNNKVPAAARSNTTKSCKTIHEYELQLAKENEEETPAAEAPAAEAPAAEAVPVE